MHLRQKTLSEFPDGEVAAEHRRRQERALALKLDAAYATLRTLKAHAQVPLSARELDLILDAVEPKLKKEEG